MFAIEVIRKKTELENAIGKNVTVMCAGKLVEGILKSVQLTDYVLQAEIDHSMNPVKWGNISYTITTNYMDREGFGPLIHTTVIDI